MKQTVVKFQNVSVVYANGFRAARNVNFEIKTGECLAIVGESGSGKTTIARAALGLLPKGANVSGSILIDETEIVGASEKTLRELRGLVVGFVAQEPFSAFNPLTKIYKHIAEAWRVHRLAAPKDLIIASLEKCGISHAEKAARNYPHEWSGGMLQRAEIVAARAHAPRLVIADEPTSALDARRADETLTMLRKSGAALLLVSHNINLAAKHADRIAVCYKGEIVEIGDAERIIESPQHFYTKVLLDADRGEKLFAPFENDSDIVLEGKNLSRVYGRGETVVNAVVEANIEVRRGEIVGICGNSGCGKSTLLRLLATIEMPTSGEVILGGELAARGGHKKLSGEKSRGGFVMPIFQDPLSSLDARWAIWRTVTEPLTAKRFSKKPSRRKRREIAAEILAEVGLREIDLNAKPGELSVGQCQRVAVARALLAKPALIVADEPTSALDASIAKTVLKLLARVAENGAAIVVVSHDEKVLRALCHRVLTMRAGVLSGQPENKFLSRQPKNKF